MSVDFFVSHMSAGIKSEPSDFSEVSKKSETWIVIQTLGNPFFFKINQSTTVDNIKQQICQRELIPVAELNIMTIESILTDSTIIWNYKDSKLYCVLAIKKSPKFFSSEMSINIRGPVQITA